MAASKINSSQLKKVFASSKELGIDNELLHTLVKNITGNEHISQLTKYQAMDVIDELEYRKTGKRKQIHYRPNMASDDQLYKIRALEKELGWDSNPLRLKAFIKKYARVENEKWLSGYAASNIIEALKKLIAKGISNKALSETLKKIE
jgi:uncharacterized protein (UPF0335 family)